MTKNVDAAATQTDTLFDASKSAAYLATTERHVLRLRYAGVLPFYKVGRYIRFRQSDLDSYLELVKHDAMRRD